MILLVKRLLLLTRNSRGHRWTMLIRGFHYFILEKHANRRATLLKFLSQTFGLVASIP